MSTAGDIATGVGAAGTVATAAGVAGGTGLATAAATATGVASSACSAVPGIGTAACAVGAAIVAGFVALGKAIASLGRDSYHPRAATALSWLTLWQFLPGTLWADNDTLRLNGFHIAHNFSRTHTPVEDACRLVRYSLIVAGLARPASPLYNPGDKGETGKDANPYLESKRPDPNHPLTDPKVVKRFYDAAVKAHAKHGLNNQDSDQTGNPAGLCDPSVGTLIQTPTDAAHALAALRSPHFDWFIFPHWEMLKSCVPGLRREIARARKLAGEHGPDPHLDAKLAELGKLEDKEELDNTDEGIAKRAKAHPHDPKVAGVGSAMREGFGFGIGLVPGLLIGGSVVAVGTALYQRVRKDG